MTDDPGLSDAIHVIGVNPALGAATIIDIPRDTEGPGGAKLNSYIVSSGGENLRAAANAVSAVVGVQLPMVVRVGYQDSFTRLPSTMGAHCLAMASRPRVGWARLAPNAASWSRCEANAAAS